MTATDGPAGVEVRPVRPEEHQAAGDLVVRAYQAIRPDLEPGYAVELREVGARVRSAEVYVAVDTGTGALLGSVTFVPDGGEYAEISRPGDAEFRMLAVAVDAQRRGIGSLLVAHCIAEARARGKQALLLSSGPWMTAAHRLYERFGFRRTPERDWSPMAGMVLVTYRLDL